MLKLEDENARLKRVVAADLIAAGTQALSSVADEQAEELDRAVRSLREEVARRNSATHGSRSTAVLTRPPKRVNSMLRLKPRWLYRHAKTMPFSRKLSPKVLRFSRAGLLRWLATRRT